ncbi:ashwin-like [Ruditapes philippinarum]|uniref:ashwin-like n=1 Tax=Ruditapes philippinarum TaxID=129788 RepID=UPI00295B0338|nr:ashwin-like [Ruditapes philippinarum]
MSFCSIIPLYATLLTRETTTTTSALLAVALTMSESEEVKQIDWMYPDLMPRDELVSILKQRYIKTESLELLNKDELVELYNEYIIPLPQRKYRPNRRGREMTKKQIIASKKRRLESSDEASDDQPKNKRRSTGNLLTSFDLPASGTGDRLKPPPSCINFEKKKIKLSNSTKPSSDMVSSCLDNITIKKRKEVKHENEAVKKIKLTNNCESDPESVTMKEGKKPVQTENSVENDVAANETQKKIKKILWP